MHPDLNERRMKHDWTYRMLRWSNVNRNQIMQYSTATTRTTQTITANQNKIVAQFIIKCIMFLLYFHHAQVFLCMCTPIPFNISLLFRVGIKYIVLYIQSSISWPMSTHLVWNSLSRPNRQRSKPNSFIGMCKKYDDTFLVNLYRKST